MYKLRFRLNDNRIVTSCDYNKIIDSNNEELVLYNNVDLDNKTLYNLYIESVTQDNNPRRRKFDGFEEVEYIVKDEFIKYIQVLIKQNKEKELKSKELEAKFTKKKKKFTLNKANKFRKRRAIIALATLLSLSQVVSSVVTKEKPIPIVAAKSYEEVTGAANNTITEQGALDLTINNIKSIHPSLIIEDFDIKDEEEVKDEVIETEPEVKEEASEEQIDYILPLYTDDWVDGKKYTTCYENYYPIIERVANTYGIDPKIALAIACHERGVHSNEQDKGGAIGLFQIQVRVWNNKQITAFNFLTNSYETYTIKLENIRNVEENIKAGIMIFQSYLKINDYNLLMGLQSYNMGPGGVRTVAKEASRRTNLPLEVIERPDNFEWLKYRNAVSWGDKSYVENIFKFVPDETILKFKIPDGTEMTYLFDNLNIENVKNVKMNP